MHRAVWTNAACALALILLATSSALAARNHAFVVGIDTYPNLPVERQLRKAVADSRTMRDVLGRLGYDVVHLEDVARRAFFDAWASFLRRIQPGDTALVFFSGHGIELHGTNYLIPGDVRSLSSDDEVRFTSEAIRFEELQANMIDRRARFSLFIIDACRDNPFAAGTKSLGGRRGLAPVSPAEGMFVMFSAGVGQEALDRLSDDDPHPNSVYTRKLAPLLATPDLDLVQIARSVRDQVRNLAASISHRQTPAYYDETSGRFCPAGCADTATGPRPVPIPAPTVPSESWFLSVYPNVDFYEGDLGPGISAPTQRACELACEADHRCRLFSYVGRLGQCYLKERLGLPYYNPRVVSGFYRRTHTGLPPSEELDVEIRWELRFNTKLTFPTIRWRNADSVMTCAELCRSYGCPAFTKHPVAEKNCELPTLFADTILGTATAPGAVTGIPRLMRVPPAETRPVGNPLLMAR